MRGSCSDGLPVAEDAVLSISEGGERAVDV